jgi:hypothetical protein
MSKETDDYYASLPHPSRRPKALPGPPDTPDGQMTTVTWGDGLLDPDTPPRRAVHTRDAQVVIHQGMTIAHCPRQYCNNAEPIQPGQEGFYCTNCRYVAPLAWPSNYNAIIAELEQRPVPQTRNWYPTGHWKAVEWGIEDGQTVADLHAEFARYGGGN